MAQARWRLHADVVASEHAPVGQRLAQIAAMLVLAYWWLWPGAGASCVVDRELLAVDCDVVQTSGLLRGRVCYEPAAALHSRAIQPAHPSVCVETSYGATVNRVTPLGELRQLGGCEVTGAVALNLKTRPRF